MANGLIESNSAALFFVCLMLIVHDSYPYRPTFKSNEKNILPIVVNTWGHAGNFIYATEAAYQTLTEGGGLAIDGVVAGCSYCEVNQCDGTVGYGGSPDENGKTTLDAMIMDGVKHDVGAVGCLTGIKNAIGVARAVMEYTTHTLLVGDLAKSFALEMGFEESSLETNVSQRMWEKWKQNNCQPNHRRNVTPNPSKSCGPYRPNYFMKKQYVSYTKKKNSVLSYISRDKNSLRYNDDVSVNNHDTIGMVVVDKNGNIAAGTSTNGASYKVPGRVGDSPIMGAGAYTSNDVGGAAATGDGDVMMRFLPSFYVVELMKQGHSPRKACQIAIARIAQFYPNFSGALVAVSKDGKVGGACHNFISWPYSVKTPSMENAKEYRVNCTSN